MISSINLNPNQSNLRTVPATLRKRWIIARRYPVSFFFWFFAPVLFLLPTLIFGTFLVGDRYSQNLEAHTGIADIWIFTGIGLTFMNFMFGVMWGNAFAIREEEFLGTLESVYVTPVSRSVLVLANGIFSFSYGIVGLVMQMTVLLYLHGEVSMINLFWALIITLVSVMLVQGISMILAVVVLTIKQGWRVVFTFQVLLSLITPATFPIGVLPEKLQEISVHSPFTFAVSGFREAILFGYSTSLLVDVLKLMIWSIILFVIGVKVYYNQDRRLRMKGSLGKY